MAKHIGRFEIVRELGRGSQSVVYLARDPHLQREVAIKTLHFSHPDPQKNQQLLAEARIVSQLRHASIVPIFEAGEEQGDIYLVFEYVAGKNLGDYLKENGRLSPPKAIAIMLPVLDAMIHAHAMGIIHRDLKPTNILIDPQELPRVMDFGIASRIEMQGGSEVLMGTPSYMAPEYISRRESSERSDVFSAGLVFYELLTGRRAVAGDDVHAVMQRIANEDIRLPTSVGTESDGLDDTLLSLLYRALARDPQQRFATARDLRDALERYLHPDEAAVSADAKQSTIDFLLRRMRHKSDFPALSDSVSKINKITGSDKESIANLSSAILKDFSLTNKILRLVNSVYFRQAGGGSISTISRAVLVLGFDAVRSIAFTVMLFEHLQNKDNTGQLKEEFLRANLAAIIAKGLAEKNTRDAEQVFICSMFHNLGRLLSQFYFAEESAEIKRLIDQKQCSEEAATVQVLGISFEELGIGIARTWGFPNLIVNSMRNLPAGPVRKATTPEERVHVLSSLANELCAVISDVDPAQRQKELRKARQRFGENLALDEQALLAAVEKSFTEVAQFASIIGINLKQSTFGRRIKEWSNNPDTLVGAEAEATGETVLADGVPAGAPGSLLTDGDAEGGEGGDISRSEVILMAGIQDISNTLVENYKINDVLRIILETMYRGKGFRRVILCVRDAHAAAMTGRFGFGPDVLEVVKQFRFSLNASSDLFLAALVKGVDVLISDARDAKIVTRLPDWYRQGVNAGTFVIFPLCIKGKPVAMIYADADLAGDIVINEKELSLLRTLRNQAVLAIKQSG